MRVIKFRFWEIASKQFIYDIDKLSKNPSVFISKIFEGDDIIIPQQYTGFNDVNNTEIYEGDIMKWHDKIIKLVFIEGGFFAVTVESKPFANWNGLDLQEPVGGLTQIPFTNLSMGEIIGHIYEN